MARMMSFAFFLSLAFSAAAQWQVRFTYSDAGGGWADTPYELVRGSNGADAGGIRTSSLPGVWITLPHGTREGDTVTATAHAFGGYVLPPEGTHWDAYACDCTPFASVTSSSGVMLSTLVASSSCILRTK